MYQTICPDFNRPKTMGQTRENTSHSHIHTHTRYNSLRNQQQQVIQEQIPIQNSSHVVLLIPQNMAHTQGSQHNQRKINPYSRENMQQMNKKYRQIRSNRASPILGLYDMQNDRRMGQVRTISALNSHVDTINNSSDIKPFVQSLKKLSERKSSSHCVQRRKSTQKAQNNKQFQHQQPFLKSRTIKRMQRIQTKSLRHQSKNDLIQKKNVDIFMPERQSQTGYVLHKFQSKLKKKTIEDNLHVMATLLKRKIKVLDKKDMVTYLKKIIRKNLQQKEI